MMQEVIDESFATHFIFSSCKSSTERKKNATMIHYCSRSLQAEIITMLL